MIFIANRDAISPKNVIRISSITLEGPYHRAYQEFLRHTLLFVLKGLRTVINNNIQYDTDAKFDVF